MYLILLLIIRTEDVLGGQLRPDKCVENVSKHQQAAAVPSVVYREGT